MRYLVFLFAALIFCQGIEAQSKSTSTDSVITIASCQFPISDTIEENARWIREQMKEAKHFGADIVHFPECALTGYPGVDMENLKYFSWTTLYEETDEILDLADELNVWVILGSFHKLSIGNKPHNSLYLINPDGKIVDRYDKRFCTEGDLDHFSPGDHFVTFQIDSVKCGLLICYDVRFPELYREYKKLDVDVLFQSFYNARQGEGSIHPYIMHRTAQVRAATNYFYMSITNSSAPQSWPCYFITPDGRLPGKLEANKPGILVSEVDISDKFYDASSHHRERSMNGMLNSGELVKDNRSKKRTGY